MPPELPGGYNMKIISSFAGIFVSGELKHDYFSKTAVQ
jgi:hypothetical protein